MKHNSLKKLCNLILFMLFVLFIPFNVIAEFPAQETDLGFDPYEANLDSQGMLWISHYLEAEIWRVNTATGEMVSFSVGGGPSDGRGDGAGKLWWADVDVNRLFRLDTTSSTVHAWEIPASSGLYTTAIDTAGQVWVMDFNDPLVYRLNPLTNLLCTYEIPGGGMGIYLAAGQETLWFGDTINARIVQIDPGAKTFTWWALPDSSYPFDVKLGLDQNLWYTDYILNQVVRLNPDENKLSSYSLPEDLSTPKMLSPTAEGIWFNFESPGGLGRLDPNTAEGTHNDLVKTTVAADPRCETVPPTSKDPVTPITLGLDWGNLSYKILHDQAGLLTFQMPEEANPYGIAADTQRLWLVDYGRSKLVSLSFPVNVTACKWKDADGTLDTTDDQTPVTDWLVYLRIDGERQIPGKLTGADGCAHWYGFNDGSNFGVEEDLLVHWVALTEPSHDFGQLEVGSSYSHTFINHREISPVPVTACKLADEDGTLNTTDDQTLVADWPVYLHIDGERQTPGKLTSADGCAHWYGFNDGSIYGVEEDHLEGWAPLTETIQDFGQLEVGGSYSFTFINHWGISPVPVTACKLADEDGNLETSDDQTPVADWPVYLRIDGERQTPGKLTGADGCAHWEGLTDGTNYGVEEDLLESWIPLSEISHDFGQLEVAGSYSYTFVNHHQQGVSIYLPMVLK